MAQKNTNNETGMAESNTDKEAAMISAPPRSDGITQFIAEEGYGPDVLVTGVREAIETIGLKLDLFGNTVESSDNSPTLEGK